MARSWLEVHDKQENMGQVVPGRKRRLISTRGL